MFVDTIVTQWKRMPHPFLNQIKSNQKLWNKYEMAAGFFLIELQINLILRR